MDEKDIKLKLLLNQEIHIDGFGTLTIPKMNEYVAMGEKTYHERLSPLLFTKNLLKVDDPSEIESYSDFEVLMNLIIPDYILRDLLINALKMLFNEEVNYIEGEVAIIHLGDDSDSRILTEDIWLLIKNIIKIGNFMKDEEDEYEAGNEQAKKFMEKLKKKKEQLANIKKEESINIHSIMSAVAWRTTGINAVGDLTVYQLYDAFYRLSTIDNYHYTTTAMYTGSIDTKGINLSEINWANVIKIN